MYCKNCGKEIKENEIFCSCCGTKISDETNSENNAGTAQTTQVASMSKNNSEISQPIGNVLKKATKLFTPLGKNGLWLISSMLFLLLNPIFALFKNIKISEGLTGSKIISESYSLFNILQALGEEIGFVKFLIIIGIISIIAAEIIMILPLITNKTYTSKYLILTKIISIAAFLLIILSHTICIYGASSESYVTYSITFGGILMIIDSICLAFSIFKFSSLLKNKKRTMNTESNETEENKVQ